jgi:hypothetical protein
MTTSRTRPGARLLLVMTASALAASCGPRRAAVIGPVPDAASVARGLESATRLEEPIRIDFEWELNEAGSRLHGTGVARAEPPYRARLDLFLANGETVVSAALVDGDLRLPYGSRDDILPPADLMWGTLGVFHPLPGTELEAGERLESGAQRLRYRQGNGNEIHYETTDGALRAVELLDGSRVVQWVRVSAADDSRYPHEATYRNLEAFRELKIRRTALSAAHVFDPVIWNPR